MVRGNNKQTIFRDCDDYNKFLSLIDEKQENDSFILYAWCLMPNHAHLLIKENREPIDTIFRSILTGFVVWYNSKYKHVGHLFQGRFKSQPVEDETYFLRAVRYIHRNSLKAKLCERMEDYPYSSYSNYFRCGKYRDEDLIFQTIRKDEFELYHLMTDENDDEFLEIDKAGKLTDDNLKELILQSGVVRDISDVRSLPRDQRTRVIQTLLQAGASYRQIHNYTGISLSIIRAVNKELHQ